MPSAKLPLVNCNHHTCALHARKSNDNPYFNTSMVLLTDITLSPGLPRKLLMSNFRRSKRPAVASSRNQLHSMKNVFTAGR